MLPHVVISFTFRPITVAEVPRTELDKRILSDMSEISLAQDSFVFLDTWITNYVVYTYLLLIALIKLILWSSMLTNFPKEVCLLGSGSVLREFRG